MENKKIFIDLDFLKSCDATFYIFLKMLLFFIFVDLN